MVKKNAELRDFVLEEENKPEPIHLYYVKVPQFAMHRLLRESSLSPDSGMFEFRHGLAKSIVRRMHDNVPMMNAFNEIEFIMLFSKCTESEYNVLVSDVKNYLHAIKK